MAIYGMNFPSGGGAFGGLANWTNISNTFSDADGDAAASWSPYSGGDSSTYYVRYFGFAIPSGTITGIKITLRRRAGASSNIKELEFKLKTVGGAVTTADLSDHSWFSTSYETIEIGGPGDTLGQSWTLSNVNASGNDLQLDVTTQNVSAGSADIEFIGITIYTDGSSDDPPFPCGTVLPTKQFGALGDLLSMLKNTAGQKIGSQMITAADGSAFTGSVTVSVTGDAGTQATGSVGSGACTHEGNGYHTYAPAQAETNYDLVAFTFTGTGAVPSTVQAAPQTASSALDAAGVRSAIGLSSANLDTQLGDLPTNAELATALGTADDAVLSAVSGIASTLAAGVDSNLVSIGGSTDFLTRFKRSVAGIVIGTVGTGSTKSVIVTSSLSPAGATVDKFRTRIMIFGNDTTTTELRGQAAVVSSITTGGVISIIGPTINGFTIEPVSGDTFTIV